MIPPEALESVTQRWGREIFHLAKAEHAQLSQLNPWVRRVLRWSLSDNRVKTTLFRFVDVLPSLRTPRQVMEHLWDSFEAPEVRMPPALRLGMALTHPQALTGRAVTHATHWMVTQIARQFICGTTLQEAFASIQRLEAQGMGFTLDLVGETTISDCEADRYREAYTAVLKGLIHLCQSHPATLPWYETSPRVNLSIKLSSLTSRFDAIHGEATCETVLARLLPIVELAKAHEAFINIDMEQYHTQNLTLEVVKRLLHHSSVVGYPHMGIVIQAYLRDSEAELRDLLTWLATHDQPLTIRLVKGAYWDAEVVQATQRRWPIPVYLQKAETDANFERLTALLLSHHQMVRTAIASHNIRSLAHALAVAEVLQVPPSRLEFQLLYGMADAIKQALIKLHQPVRVYAPYGELIPGMAYLIRRLLENTSNDSFLKHDFLHEASEEELLRSPQGPAYTAEALPTATSVSLPPPNFHNEPLLDFSQEAARRQMETALQSAWRQFGAVYPLVINGEEIATPETFPSLNPAHKREVVGHVARATREYVERAVAGAKAAWPAWRDTMPTERAACLRRAGDLLAQRRVEIAAWEVFEVGKNWREADVDVTEAIDFLRYYAAEMETLAAGRPVNQVPGERNQYVYLPRGVGVVISPWNFPLALLTGMTAAALVTGNAVILKPSSQSSVVAAQLVRLLLQAGVPPGILQFLPGAGGEIGDALVDHSDIQFVAFTGSRAVGLALAERAAHVQKGQRHVKKVIAEMGGKNAIIVDDDADLDEAIPGILTSAFGYQGQKCSACSRLIVHQDIYDVLLPRLLEAVDSLPVAFPEDPRSVIGPLIDAEAQQRVLAWIVEGEKTAHLAYRKDVGTLAEEGWFVGPAIFTEVNPRSPLAQEEIFGPVLSVIKARDFTEALTIANDSAYALTGGLYSRRPSHIEQASRALEVGNLYINRQITGAVVGRQPFGGYKLSGIGSKAGGPDYLLQFLVPKTITENTLRHGLPL